MPVAGNCPDLAVAKGLLRYCTAWWNGRDPVDEPRFIQTLHSRGYRLLAGAKDAAQPRETGKLTGIVGRS